MKSLVLPKDYFFVFCKFSHCLDAGAAVRIFNFFFNVKKRVIDTRMLRAETYWDRPNLTKCGTDLGGIKIFLARKYFLIFSLLNFT